MSLASALYHLSTGKLTWTPEILIQASYLDLFNHFVFKLLADPTWAEMEAGTDYFHYSNIHIPCQYILKGKAGWFTSQVYNLIHLDVPMREISPYQWPNIDLPLISYTPEPLPDELPVPPK